MNPRVSSDTLGLAHKDAVFFSIHKFVGGPQTPGLLIAKKSIFQNSVPVVPGGGTVLYVTETEHRYLEVSCQAKVHLQNQDKSRNSYMNSVHYYKATDLFENLLLFFLISVKHFLRSWYQF